MTDKERYATIGTWVQVFREEGVKVSVYTVRERLKQGGVIGETARTKIGCVIRDGFYSESEVRNLCSDLLESLPQADEKGLVQKDGESYGTILILSRLLGLYRQGIRSRIRQNPPKSIRGKDQCRHVRDFYSLSEVRNLCSDLLEPLPQADEHGLLEKDGQTYGTIKGFSRLLGISEKPIQLRIRQKASPSIRGKVRNGRIQDFYPLSEIRNLCSDLLEPLPQANELGLFEKDGQTYGTFASLSRVIGISEPTVKRRIQSSSLKPIQGKDKGGRVCDFYILPDVQKLCADLIAKKSNDR